MMISKNLTKKVISSIYEYFKPWFSLATTTKTTILIFLIFNLQENECCKVICIVIVDKLDWQDIQVDEKIDIKQW